MHAHEIAITFGRREERLWLEYLARRVDRTAGTGLYTNIRRSSGSSCIP